MILISLIMFQVSRLKFQVKSKEIFRETCYLKL